MVNILGSVNINSVNIPIYYKFLWCIETYIFHYKFFVRYKFKRLSIGNVLHTLFSVISGVFIAYKSLIGDYETLNNDLLIFKCLKEK